MDYLLVVQSCVVKFGLFGRLNWKVSTSSTYINYKMNANTKRGAQPLMFVQKKYGWQSVL